MSDRSEAQIAAARQNGQNSKGPQTPEGKLKSRQNALKHGLTAEVVLPPDLKSEVEAEILIYERAMKPQGEFEQRMVHKAALSSVKFLRLAHAELTHASERQRTALDEWDRQRERHATALFTVIQGRFEGKSQEIAQAYVDLTHTSAGLRLMAQAWDDLIATLDAYNHWNPANTHKAARLLGYFANLQNPDCPFDFQSLAQDAQTTVDAIQGRATDVEGARCKRALLQLAQDERNRLLKEADHIWQTREAPSRQEAPARALLDPSPEGQLLQRYKNDAHRIEQQAHAQLARHRKTQAQERASG